MRLFFEELRKLLLNRVNLILLAVLLIANCVTVYLSVDSQWDDYGYNVPASPVDVEAVLDIYIQDPERYHELQNRAYEGYAEAYQLGKEYDVYSLGPKRSANDYQLFAKTAPAIRYYEGHADRIQKVLDDSLLRKEQMDRKNVDKNAFSYRYQEHVMEIYKPLKDVLGTDYEYVYVSGWDTYLNYSAVNIFMLLYVLLMAAQMINTERTTGMLPIIHTTRKGHRAFLSAKLGASCVISLFATLIFTLTTFVMVGLCVPYSDGNAPIQLIREFELAASAISIKDTAIMIFGFRCLSAVAFFLICVAISVFFHYALTCVISAAVLLVNLLIFLNPTDVQYRYLNLFSMAARDTMSRYRAVSVFGAYADLIPVSLVLYGILILAPILLLLIRGRLNTPAIVLLPTLKALWEKIPFSAPLTEKIQAWKKAHAGKKTRAPRLFCGVAFAEVLKNRATLLLVLALLIVQAYNVAEAPVRRRAFNDKMYEEYMDKLEGPVTEEKLSFITEEAQYIASVLAKEKSMSLAYELGEISWDEYEVFKNEYYYCSDRSEAIRDVQEHALYLQKVQAEKNIDAYFFYDRGIVSLFRTALSPLTICAIVLLCGNAFVPEHRQTSSSHPISSIVRSTRRGRGAVYYKKYLVCMVTVLLTVLVLLVLDAYTVQRQYGVFDEHSAVWGYHIANLEQYEGCTLSLSCGAYYAMVSVFRCIGYFLLANLCFALSNLCKKPLGIYTWILILVLIPFALVNLGLEAFDTVNLLRLCNANDVLATLPTYYLLYGAFVLVIGAVCVFSHLAWVGRKRRHV